MGGSRAKLSLVIAILFVTAAVAIVPHGLDAQAWLVAQDDPVALADRALDRSFNAATATREITAALAADDADLAASFLDLAAERGVPVDGALAQRVAEANTTAAQARRAAGGFWRGLISGEPDDLATLAGTTAGDLFVFGDIRDAARESMHIAVGEPADHLVLGLACVGIAVTAGTYGTAGAAAPARVGLTVIKAARKTGRIGGRMAAWIGHSLREVVDVPAIRRAFASASITQPVLVVRAARDAVKIEKAGGLMHLVEDLGKVERKAGTRAALDGLKVVETPADMARVAKLAEKKGSKTRAILRLLGRGAIVLTLSLFDLAWWIFWAALMLLGFVSSAKATVERLTERHLARRKARRARALARQARVLAAVPAAA